MGCTSNEAQTCKHGTSRPPLPAQGAGTGHRLGLFRIQLRAAHGPSRLPAPSTARYRRGPAKPSRSPGAGFHRTIPVGSSGKYSITLPVGTYTVSLLRDGKVVRAARSQSGGRRCGGGGFHGRRRAGRQNLDAGSSRQTPCPPRREHHQSGHDDHLQQLQQLPLPRTRRTSPCWRRASTWARPNWARPARHADQRVRRCLDGRERVLHRWHERHRGTQ